MLGPAIRYTLTNLFLVCFIGALLAGGWIIWLVFSLAVLVAGVLDELLGDEESEIRPATELWLNSHLYATLPLLVVLTYSLVLYACPSCSDSPANTAPALAGAVLGTGNFYALAGVTVAHELTYRIDNPIAQLWSRVLLAFTLNSTFESYHLRDHHRNVCTFRDAATARRDEYVLAFVLRTQSIQGWRLKAACLRTLSVGPWSRRNRILAGVATATVIVGAAGLAGGIAGMAAFAAAAVIGRVLHEMINYVQHYGFVRCESEAIEARVRLLPPLSNALQYNLPRHSVHYLSGSEPFWALSTTSGSPKLPHGDQTMALIASILTWWHRVMDERLAHWDEHLASYSKRSIIAQRGSTVAQKLAR